MQSVVHKSVAANAIVLLSNFTGRDRHDNSLDGWIQCARSILHTQHSRLHPQSHRLQDDSEDDRCAKSHVALSVDVVAPDTVSCTENGNDTVVPAPTGTTDVAATAQQRTTQMNVVAAASVAQSKPATPFNHATAATAATQPAIPPAESCIPIAHAHASRATDYVKKPNVFRLRTRDGAVYLFEVM